MMFYGTGLKVQGLRVRVLKSGVAVLGLAHWNKHLSTQAQGVHADVRTQLGLPWWATYDSMTRECNSFWGDFLNAISHCGILNIRSSYGPEGSSFLMPLTRNITRAVAWHIRRAVSANKLKVART